MTDFIRDADQEKDQPTSTYKIRKQTLCSVSFATHSTTTTTQQRAEGVTVQT